MTLAEAIQGKSPVPLLITKAAVGVAWLRELADDGNLTAKQAVEINQLADVLDAVGLDLLSRLGEAAPPEPHDCDRWRAEGFGCADCTASFVGEAIRSPLDVGILQKIHVAQQRRKCWGLTSLSGAESERVRELLLAAPPEPQRRAGKTPIHVRSGETVMEAAERARQAVAPPEPRRCPNCGREEARLCQGCGTPLSRSAAPPGAREAPSLEFALTQGQHWPETCDVTFTLNGHEFTFCNVRVRSLAGGER